MGPVAQRIRARGYEPQCRGLESLLAHKRPPELKIPRKNGEKCSQAFELGKWILL